MGKQLPWIKWYPADWRADPRVRMCSLAARGLWIELLGYMHESPRYGYLMIGDTIPDERQIATLVGEPLSVVKRALAELSSAGVFSIDDDIIYSRRMVRDKAKADTDAGNGARGGNPSLIGGVNPQHNQDGNPQDKATCGRAPKPQKPEARSQNNSDPDGSGVKSRASPRSDAF